MKKIQITDFVDDTSAYYKIYLKDLSLETLKSIPEEVLIQMIEDKTDAEIDACEEAFLAKQKTLPHFLQQEEEEVKAETPAPKPNPKPTINMNPAPEEQYVKKEQRVAPEVKPEVETKKADNDNLFDIVVSSGASVSKVEMNYTKFLSKTVNSTYFVILPISGYSANVRGLTVAEMDSVKNSFTSDSDRLDILSRIVFSAMLDTSIGVMTYDQFVDGTAQQELEILIFAIIVKTFGSVNEVGFTCSKCGTSNSGLKININNLVQFKSDEVLRLMNVIELKEEPLNTFKNSVLTKKELRRRLPETRIIVSIKFGSVERQTSVITFSAQHNLETSSTISSVLNFIDAVYVPIMDDDGNETGTYYCYKSLKDIYAYIKNLKSTDFKVIDTALNEELRIYNVDFKAAINCGNTKCNHKNEIGINVVENFYLSIFQEMT